MGEITPAAIKNGRLTPVSEAAVAAPMALPTAGTGGATGGGRGGVPMFELATQWQVIRNEVEAAVKEVLESQQYTSGAESGKFVGRFEEQFAELVGGKVVALSSGTDALLAAMMALGIGGGTGVVEQSVGKAEVITTPFSFFATAGCVVRAGARPVFVDIDPGTFLMDIAAVEGAITPRTRAIIPVHLFGQMALTRALAEIAGRHGVDVIEDAAQCIGARDPEGRQIGENARCAAVSFYPTKNLGAAGDAGALVTRDEGLARRFKQTRQHGESTRYHHEFVGGNFRMDALQAAVLSVKIKWLDRWNNRRREIAAYYTSRLAGSDVRPPVEAPGVHHVYHQYVIRAPRRDALRDHLARRGVGCAVFYPKPLHLQACFADLGYGKGAFPVAEQACEEVLALPVFPELSNAQVENVAEAVCSFYR